MFRAIRIWLDTKFKRYITKHVFVRTRELVNHRGRFLSDQGSLQRRSLQRCPWIYHWLFDGALSIFIFNSHLLDLANWQNFLTGRDIPMMNENAISNILIDVDFLEDELKRIGRSHLSTVFTELRLVSNCVLIMWYAHTQVVRLDNIDSVGRHCSGISCACEQTCFICRCETQAFTGIVRKTRSLRVNTTGCPSARNGRKAPERSRSSWTCVSWGKSLSFAIGIMTPWYLFLSITSWIVNYSM